MARMSAAGPRGGTMRTVEDWLYDRLGTHWCGGTHPPGDHLEIRLAGNRWYGSDTVRRCRVGDDGRVLRIWHEGEDEMAYHLGHRHAFRLAWWVLWRWWGVGHWFGLRPAIWYWLLRRKIARTDRMIGRMRRTP
jgi:hypothetical protein